MKDLSARPAVVFDLDGTLLDSLPLVLAAIRHAIEPFGGTATMDLFSNLGGPPEKFLGPLVGGEANLPEALARMYAFHAEHHELIRPYPGAVETLSALREQGREVAVWTGRDRRSTEDLVRRLGLEDRFAAVVCGDDLPTHKPDPDGLREILRRLGRGPAECVMVGDADVDVLGAHACAVDAMIIRHQRALPAEITEKSWRVVGTPAEAYASLLGRS
jgi:pyrophosphatase PpaX